MLWIALVVLEVPPLVLEFVEVEGRVEEAEDGAVLVLVIGEVVDVEVSGLVLLLEEEEEVCRVMGVMERE